MCGLLAGSGKINPKILCALGCQNSARGSDSAGIGWVDRGTPQFFKIAQNPLVAFPKTLYASTVKAARSGVAIGHTRHATHGSVTSDNAHPFVDKGVVFAHNGIITNYKQFGPYAVDSESLIHGIVKRDFSEYDGDIALVWIQNGKLHAYRNGNPLYRGRRDSAIYLASDDDYLKDVGCTQVKPLGVGHIYVFKENWVEEARRVPVNQTYIITHPTTYTNRKWDSDVGDWRTPGGTSIVDESKPANETKKPDVPTGDCPHLPENFETQPSQNGMCGFCGMRSVGPTMLHMCEPCAEALDDCAYL